MCLVNGGIPRDKAEATVRGKQEFYQSEKEIFDPAEIPEINELEAVWAELSPEQQQSFLATSPWVAGTASLLDNLLPVSFLWALPDEYEAQVRNAMQENQGVTNAAEIAGTVMGLIGGPAAAAKIAKQGIKLIRTTAQRRAGFRTTREIKKLKGSLTELLTDAAKGKYPYGAAPGTTTAQVFNKLSKNIAANVKELDRTLKELAEAMYDEKLPLSELRDRSQRLYKNLPDDHPLRSLFGDDPDFFDTFWQREPKAGLSPSNFAQHFKNVVSYRVREVMLNIVPEATAFAGKMTADMTANWVYSYNDFKEQGLSEQDAKAGAWQYAFDRAPST